MESRQDWWSTIIVYRMFINNFWDRPLKLKFFSAQKLLRWFHFTRGSFTFDPIYGFQNVSCPNISHYNTFSKFWQLIRIVCFQCLCSNEWMEKHILHHHGCFIICSYFILDQYSTCVSPEIVREMKIVGCSKVVQ